MAGHAKEKIFEVKNYTAGTTKKNQGIHIF
jgi:hypothetical protein